MELSARNAPESTPVGWGTGAGSQVVQDSYGHCGRTRTKSNDAVKAEGGGTAVGLGQVAKGIRAVEHCDKTGSKVARMAESDRGGGT